MIWASLAIGVFVMTSLIILIARLTVTVSKTSSNALATLVAFDQRAHAERELYRQQQQGLIDRLMSQDWEAVRLHEGAAETPYGGFLSPQDQAKEEEMDFSVDQTTDEAEDEGEPTVEMQTRGSWGHVNAMQDRANALDEAEALAMEDDLDDFESDQERRVRQARERGLVS